MVPWCAHEDNFHHSHTSAKSSHHLPPRSQQPALVSLCTTAVSPAFQGKTRVMPLQQHQGAHRLGVRKASTESRLWPWAGFLSGTSHCPAMGVSPLSNQGTCRPALQPGTPGLWWNGPSGSVGPATSEPLLSEQSDPCQGGCKPSDALNKHWRESLLQPWY